MRLQSAVWFFIMAGLITGCVSVTAIPVISTSTPTLTASATITSTPFLTLTPSVTPIPSVTPFPPLSSAGPYLVLRQERVANRLFIYDKDGRGRRTLTLPDGCYIQSRILQHAFSSDGDWLVCYTGSFSFQNTTIAENLPLSLYLIYIADGTSRKVTDVVTTGYLEKLVKVSNELQNLFPDRYEPEDGINWASGVIPMAFEWGIFEQSWSPDSRQLAFAGQMDGNSSDVYTYDLETGIIQRAEDSLQNVSSIQWSPTGEYLVFQNSWPGVIYVPTSFHAVRVGGNVVKEPKTLASWWFGGVIDWLSPTVLLTTDGTDTAGSTTLSTIDISTGEEKEIWGGMYGEVAVDHENLLIALTASEFTPEQDWGMHFITFEGTKKKIADGWYYNLFFRGGDQNRFSVLRYSKPESQVGISLDGSVSELNWQKGNISISPDYFWVLIYDEKGAYLYDKNDELVKSLDVTNIDEVIWRPDSQGFFYSTWYELYCLSIPSGKSIYVDGCVTHTQECSFSLDQSAAWLP